MTEHGSDDRTGAGNKSGGKNKTGNREKNRKSRKKKGLKSVPPNRKAGGDRKPGPPRVHRPRVTKAEVAQRVGVVSRLILEGHSRPRHIRRALAQKFGEGEIGWYVADDRAPGSVELEDLRAIPWRTVQHYITTANLELSAMADEQRAIAKGKARGRFELALVGAVGAEQWDTVRKINRDLVRLDGLEPGQRVHVEGSIDQRHSGAVDHTVRPGGTLEERAATIANLFGTALARRAAATTVGQN